MGRPIVLEYGARLSLRQGLRKETNLTPSTLNSVSANNRKDVKLDGNTISEGGVLISFNY